MVRAYLNTDFHTRLVLLVNLVRPLEGLLFSFQISTRPRASRLAAGEDAVTLGLDALDSPEHADTSTPTLTA